MYLHHNKVEIDNFLQLNESMNEIQFLLNEGLIDASKEKIKGLFNKFANSDKIKKNTKDYKIVQNQLETQLTKAGVNLNKFKQLIKKEVNDPSLKNEFMSMTDKESFKTKLNNKQSQIKEKINKLVSLQMKHIKSKLEGDKSVPQDKITSILMGMRKAIITYSVMSFISNVCFIFFANSLAPLGLLHLVNMIAVSILAPIVEEIAKHISIKQNNMWYFFILFNTMEFTTYVLQMMSKGVPFQAAAFIRLLVIGMHLSTTLVQKKFIDAAKKTETPSLEKIGLFVGMLMHSFWNNTGARLVIGEIQRHSSILNI